MRSRLTPAPRPGVPPLDKPRTRRRRSRAARFAVSAAAAIALGTGALASPAGAETPDVRLVEASSTSDSVISLPGRSLVTDSQGQVTGEPNFGSLSVRPNRPVVAAEATSSKNGYWLAASDGGVFSFGDAHFHGSTGGVQLNQPVVGIAATPTSHGYWLVARDGGVFSFGDAHFHGSTGGVQLNQPVVDMAPTPSGHGYWLVARDGGVFTFGDAHFHGSAVGQSGRYEGIVSTSDGAGYWLIDHQGNVRGFGSAESASVTTPAGTEVIDVGSLGNRIELGYATPPPPPPPPPPAAPAVAGISVSAIGSVPAAKVANFERLSQCEAGGNWSINTGNGYYGGLQFALSSWRAVGGTGLPHQHSKAEQIYRGHLLQERQGWGAWPACSRKLGIR